MLYIYCDTMKSPIAEASFEEIPEKRTELVARMDLSPANFASEKDICDAAARVFSQALVHIALNQSRRSVGGE